jgi:catechol 2,3-dioxygenase-like lactoylglutathione lyase family enzyme
MMTEPSDLGSAHLRVVRPSDDLAANLTFYRDGLGLELLSEFKDHDGFDAVILGRKGAAYHLAFVHKAGHKAGRAPGEDNLLVFYLPDANEWQRAVRRLEDLGHRPVKAFNPYWDKRGKTFEDPDGYRVVLQHASWPG